MSCTSFLVSYLESTWVASDLPIIYGIDNDKWPVNNTDQTDSFNAVTDDNGYARLAIPSPNETYSVGNYIKITGATLSGHNGVWRIRAVYSSTDITVEAPFLGTDSGTLQKYYKNYHNVVKVYTGIRDGHTHASSRPMELRGTLRVRPDENNVSNVNISSLVRSDLAPIDNNFCELEFTDGWANDFNQFTQFYIEFAESYDVAVGGVLETFTSGFYTNEDTNGDPIIYSAAKAANNFQYAQGRSMAEYALNALNYDGGGRFMTKWARPTYFEGYEWDVSIINDFKNADLAVPNRMFLVEYAADNTILGTSTYEMPSEDEGVYRFNVGHHTFFASCSYFVLFVNYDRATNNFNSNSLTVNYQNRCVVKNPIYLRWLNQVGGWDGWLFIRNKDLIVDVQDRTTVTRDIFSNWDQVFTRGTTQEDYISTQAVERRIVRTQLLNEDEATQLGYELRVSNKVQEIYLSTDTDCGNDERRTVLIEPGQFTYLSDRQKIREVEVEFRYTDKIIVPGQ